MTFTSTADRITNYGVAVMACVCFSLWVLDSYFLSPMQIQDTRNVRSAVTKSIPNTKKDSTRASDGGYPRVTASKVVAQKGEKAGVHTKIINPKSRMEETPVTDAERRVATMYYRKHWHDQFYRDAYKLLELDDASNEALRDLLVERYMAVEKAKNTRSENEDVTYESRVNNSKSVALEYNEKIADLLGPEKYALLYEYEAALPHRNEIRMFRGTLEFSGEPLSVEQEMALLPAIDKYLSLYPSMEEYVKTWSHINPGDSIGGIDFDEEEHKTIFQDVLTPGQIEALADAYKRMLKLATQKTTLRDLGL